MEMPSRLVPKRFFHSGRPPFEEGPAIGTALDDSMGDTRHLGGNGSHRLTAQIGVVMVLGHVALELVAEAIVTLLDGDLSGLPERAPQARIADS
jgi:hypothetical protein